MQMFDHDDLSGDAELKGDGGMLPVERIHCASATKAPAKSVKSDNDDDHIAILERSEAPAIRESVFHIGPLAQRSGFADVTQKYWPIVITDDLENK